jgi:hypothetical protein
MRQANTEFHDPLNTTIIIGIQYFLLSMISKLFRRADGVVTRYSRLEYEELYMYVRWEIVGNTSRLGL